MTRTAFFTAFLALLLNACASYQPRYSRGAPGWETQSPDPALTLTHSIFLIGDAGNADPGQTPPALRLLAGQLQAAGQNSTVLFLGDNIYPDGMTPDSTSEEGVQDRYRLQVQLDALAGYAGRPIFIAGNHDWYGYGLEGLRQQKAYAERRLGRKDVFLPEPGCGDPMVVDINTGTVLVLLDSHWWLEGRKEAPASAPRCDLQDLEALQARLKAIFREHQHKQMIVALHHPPYTNGPHGGRLTWVQHLFPLRDLHPLLFIPLPGLGLLRSLGAHPQDAAHPRYRALRQALTAAAAGHERVVFVSGHEHNLQYFELGGQSFLVSGAGSKRSPSSLGRGSVFAYGHAGFARLDCYDDGSAWVQFWVPEGQSEKGRVVFRGRVN